MGGGNKKRSSFENVWDMNKALSEAIKCPVPEEVFLSGQLKTFLMAKAEKIGVFPSMILPSLLASVASVMNMSEFELTDGWVTNSNIFILCVANKGGGKTPSGKIFLDPLIELERNEKAEFDRNEYDKDGGKGDEGEDEPGIKRMRKDSEKHEEEDDEGHMFHRKQRCVDSITPEALIMSLRYGTGVLMIKTDEFKGFYDKYVVGAQNISALASAYSGEPISYTTVKRGGVTIYDNRLTIFGSVQPGPLFEMVNGLGCSTVDHQGFWDRFILIATSVDHDADFDFQMEKMEEEALFDVGKFLNAINSQHQQTRRYKCSKAGLEEIKRVKRELKDIDRQANFGNETTGMTAKSFTNVLKLCPIYSCCRQVIHMMEKESDDPILFEVCKADVVASWAVVKLSMFTYQQFKTSLHEEDVKETQNDIENPLTDEEIDEEVIFSGIKKIVRIYKVAKNGKILLSVLKRDNLYPKGDRINLEVFLKALEKFGIAKRVKVTAENSVKTESLSLTQATDSVEGVRIFRLLWERAKDSQLMFDPLNRFE